MNNMKEGAYAAGSVGTGSTYATGYTPLFVRQALYNVGKGEPIDLDPDTNRNT